MPERSRGKAHDAALTAREFDSLLSPLGPFESKPVLAAAVSGGSDSMALALLAAGWAKARNGRLVALVVDHRLRRGSTAEARRVRSWLQARGIACRVLTWTGRKPATGLQAAARAARYRLLSDWCRRNGVLHLMTAHTRDDQAETFLLRLERGSGPDGLAGMAAAAEGPDLRLIRPLLSIPKSRLQGTLRAHAQDWIEDPSNRNAAFARVAVRRLLAGPHALLDAEPIARAAETFGRLRRLLDETVSRWLARYAAVYPAAYITVDAGAFRAAAPEIARRALTRCLLCVSGHEHPPRGERLERLLAELRNGAFKSARTLGGCRIIPAGTGILICAEPARTSAMPLPRPVSDALWGRRFRVAVRSAEGGGLRLGALGAGGWSEIVQAEPQLRAHPVPHPARLALPALRSRGRIVSVPQLGFRRTARRGGPGLRVKAWQPANPLTGAGFWVAKRPSGII